RKLQLGVNRGQPHGLHESIERKSLPQILHERLTACRISCQYEDERREEFVVMAAGSEGQRRGRLLPRLGSVPKDGFPKRGLCLPQTGGLTVVRARGGSDGASRQFPRLGKVAGIRFGVGF